MEFSVSYQYESSTLGRSIFQQIAENFNLPSWMEIIPTSKTNAYKIDTIGTRLIFRNPKEKQFQFLLQDSNQDKRIKNLIIQSQDDLTIYDLMKLGKNIVELQSSSYKRLASISILWQKGLLILNDYFSQKDLLQLQEQLQITLFLKIGLDSQNSANNKEQQDMKEENIKENNKKKLGENMKDKVNDQFIVRPYFAFKKRIRKNSFIDINKNDPFSIFLKKNFGEDQPQKNKQSNIKHKQDRKVQKNLLEDQQDQLASGSRFQKKNIHGGRYTSLLEKKTYKIQMEKEKIKENQQIKQDQKEINKRYEQELKRSQRKQKFSLNKKPKQIKRIGGQVRKYQNQQNSLSLQQRLKKFLSQVDNKQPIQDQDKNNQNRFTLFQMKGKKTIENKKLYENISNFPYTEYLDQIKKAKQSPKKQKQYKNEKPKQQEGMKRELLQNKNKLKQQNKQARMSKPILNIQDKYFDQKQLKNYKFNPVLQNQGQENFAAIFEENIYIFAICQYQLIKLALVMALKESQLDENQLIQKKLKGIQYEQILRHIEIEFNIKCIKNDKLFNKSFDKCNKIKLYHQSIKSNYSRNKFSYVKRPDKLNEINTFDQKHYNLAFQGGGAKGFAYVGAYKALREDDSKKIPIKSIIGSSAGGIVALAASTGISWSQVQNICYLMNNIPEKDRILTEDNTDEFGNPINFSTFQKNLKNLLKEYGIINSLFFDKIANYFKKEQFKNVIQQKLISILKAVNPSIAPIFEIKNQEIIKKQYLFGLWSTYSTIQRTHFNWSGLLFHGALMKGQAIKNISIQCLIRYCRKQIKSDNNAFRNRLTNSFRQNSRIQYPAIRASSIINHFQILSQLDKYLLDINIGQLPLEKLSQFFIYMINVLFIKINSRNEQYWRTKINQLSYQQVEEYFAFEKTLKYQNSLLLKLIQIVNKRGIILEKIQEKIVNHPTHNEQQRTLRLNHITMYKEQFFFIRSIEQFINFMCNNKFLHHMILSSICEQIDQILEEVHCIDKIIPISAKMAGFRDKLLHLTKITDYNQIQLTNGSISILAHKNFQRNEGLQQRQGLTILHFLFNVLNPENETQLIQMLKQIQFSKQIYNFFIGSKQENLAINAYTAILQSISKQLSQLTMKQYYSLTGIQLTCTSVDLDQNKLRLFNHKTTPDLPVCKAVQMTGSFPVAFKAERWDPKWGYYYIQNGNRRIPTDISGHQFTDGGLLANFPIKYFDNELISSKYFAHRNQKDKSIMLGFGLDVPEAHTYKLSQQQLKKQNLKKVFQSMSINQLANSIDTISNKIYGFIQVFWTTQWFTFVRDKIKLGQLNNRILDKLPLFRFIKKIIKAYPNADRNFNIEAFQDQIIVNDMLDINDSETNKSIIYKNASLEQKKIIENQEKRWKFKMLYLDYQHFKRVIPAQYLQNYRQEIPNQILQQSMTIKKEILKTVLNNRIQLINQGYRLNYNNNLEDDTGRQSTKSLYLLKILLLTLKNGLKQNSQQLNQILSQRYVYFRYFAAKVQMNGRLPQNLSFNDQINCKQQLNYINFQKLFDDYNIKQISKHLNFKNVEDQFLQQCKKEKISFDDMQTFKIEKQKKNSILKNINYKLINQKFYFANRHDFYVKDNISRLTKYLYLQIKCQNRINNGGIQKLVKIVEETGYQKLIDQNYRLEGFNYLTFQEILAFLLKLREGIRVQQRDNLVKLELQQQFDTYLGELARNGLEQPIRKSVRAEASFYYKLQNFGIQINDRQKLDQSQAIYEQLAMFPEMKYYSKNSLNIDRGFIDEIGQVINQNDSDKTNAFLNFLSAQLNYEVQGLKELNLSKQIKIGKMQQQGFEILKQIKFGKHFRDLNLIKAFFGQLLESIILRQRIYQDYVPYYQNLFEQEQNNNNKFSFAQRYVYEQFYIKTLRQYIDYKIQFTYKNYCQRLQEKERQNDENFRQVKSLCRKLTAFHKIYLMDMEYLLRYLNKIYYFLTISNRANNRYVLKSQRKVKYLTHNIFMDFVEQYSKLAQKATNQLTIQTLNKAFTIKLNHTNKIFQMINSLKSLRLSSPVIDQTINQFFKRKFSLPLFDSDISVLFTTNSIKYTSVISKFFKMDNLRRHGFLNNPLYFSKNKNQYIQILNQKIKNQRNKEVQIQPNNQLANNQWRQRKVKIHLVLQGIGNSSDYFSIIYDQLFNNSREQIQLKMITCNGFHSIFGFLLVLGKDTCQIRDDMLKISKYAYEMFDAKKIDAFFKSEGNMRAEPNYLKLQKYLTSQLTTVFQYFQKNVGYFTQKYNYQKRFKDIRMLIEDEKSYYLQTCNKILDETQSVLQYFHNEHIDPVQPKQIAKKFAFDYKCSFEERHKYRQNQDIAKQQYLQLLNMFYQQFGDILSAVFCNIIARNSCLIIQEHNVPHFSKGALVMRMLTVYKLKHFVYQELDRYGLPRNITLKQLYDWPKFNKIVLNFTVINISEKRFEMFNKLVTPRMPVWAAIIATSSMPVIHRDFWGKKQWQQLQVSKKYHQIKQLQFFGEEKFLKRQNTFYNNSVYVSSLPLQLLTNSTFQERMQSYDQSSEYKDLQIMAIAFNPNYSGNLSQMDLQRKPIKLSMITTIKMGASYLLGVFTTKIPNLLKSVANFFYKNKDHQKRHYNKNYEIQYKSSKNLSNFLFNTNTMKTYDILVNSNDNLIMKSYYDRLIRLPIKCDTLDFNKTIDKEKLKNGKIYVPSLTAEQTTIRSYLITKAFINNIQNRYFQRTDQQKIVRQHTDYSKRFILNIRAQIMKIPNKNSGLPKDYFKILFINHSQWNRNMYNNFVIECKIYSQQQQQLFQFQRVQNSEFYWPVSLSSKIMARFYYPTIEEIVEQGRSKFKNIIMFTQFILDFSDMKSQLPFRASYDYSFEYTWGFYGKIDIDAPDRMQKILIPEKMNNIGRGQVDLIVNRPQLKVIITQDQNRQNDNAIVNPTIKRANFRF